jgi:ankyrin repeat protein
VNWLRHLVLAYHATDARDFHGRTIAHFAAAGLKLVALFHSGFLPIVKPHFWTADADGRTPIHYSIRMGAIDDVKLLLAEGVPADQVTEDHERWSLLDVALERNAYDVARFLLGLDVNWRRVSSSAFFAMASRPGWGDPDELDPIVTALLNRGFDPTACDKAGKDLLTVAAETNPALMWFMFRRIPGLLSNLTPSNPMLVAAKRLDLGLLSRFYDCHVEIDFRSSTGQTPLMKAVEHQRYQVIDWLLKRGASPNLPDLDGVSAMDRAMEMADCHALALFSGQTVQHRLGFVRCPEECAVLYVPKSRDRERYFIFSADHPRFFVSFPLNTTHLDLPTVIGFLLACDDLVVTRKPVPSKARDYDFTMTFRCGFCLRGRSKLRLKWTVDASKFLMSTRACCVHCFEGFADNSHPNGKLYAAIARQRPDPERSLGRLHPFHKLSRNLLRQGYLTAEARTFLERFQPSCVVSSQPVPVAEFRSLDQVVQRLPGWTEVYWASTPGYPLQYSGKSVVVFVWIAPWTPDFLFNSLNVYSELDASFEALDPYCCCVPTVVSRNVGVPLGLVICPTERAAMYEAFTHALGAIRGDFDGPRLQEKFLTLPLLSDQGTALGAFAQKFNLPQYFCVRHLLESLGSKTIAALLARRLLFIGSERDYNLVKWDAFAEFGCAIRLKQVTDEAQKKFCELFGLAVLEDGKVVEADANRFREQALWGSRKTHGVAACTNHVEGFHGRLNEIVKRRRLLVRRIWLLVLALRKKASRFHLNVSRSAHATLKKLQEQGAAGDPRPNCECGWSDIYSARFGIPDFPCKHMVHGRTPVVPVVDSLLLHWHSPGSVTVEEYVGREWPFATPWPKRHAPIPEFENCRTGVANRIDQFIQDVKFDLSMMFPATSLTHLQLAADLGSWVQVQTGHGLSDDASELDDALLRTKFQLKWITQLTRRKQQEAQGDD